MCACICKYECSYVWVTVALEYLDRSIFHTLIHRHPIVASCGEHQWLAITEVLVELDSEYWLPMVLFQVAPKLVAHPEGWCNLLAAAVLPPLPALGWGAAAGVVCVGAATNTGGVVL